MSVESSFGMIAKSRRRELGLTQDELARRVGCAPITLRKIEADDLRPSVQIAERMAMALNIPLEERSAFVKLARTERSPLEEPKVTPMPAPEEIGMEDLNGRAIRGYALGERLGYGGMGVVYRAVQPLVEREVAIKIILPKYADHPDFIRRFEAEAQLVARLEHPHIVPLYDYWREPGVAYLIMRLLRGGSVQTILRNETTLSPETVLRMMEQIGSALSSAHRAGVVHRDLKPANVLLDEDNNAYLADFGIAKNLSSPSSNTQADMVIGSPDYISPEQIRSEFVRPQTDIYALGVMLYELLTGKVPFRGNTPFDVMSQHLSVPLPPLAANRIGLPKSLDDVIEHATAKDPLKRYETVDAMLEDIREALQDNLRDIKSRAVASQKTTLVFTSIDNPYKGLRAFGEGDAQDFFGREALTQQLLVRLGEGGELSRFLAVVGPSGSGKSSVVKAGLIPALQRGALPGSENWFIIEMVPGSHPLEELEAALLRVAVNPPASLIEQFRGDSRGLIRAVHRSLPDDPSIELVLVIDQFEEAFTLLQDENERLHFLGLLVSAILDEQSRVRVVLTLRADFIDRPLNYVDFGELLKHRAEFVLPLTPDELEHAIASPAERVGLTFESGLTAAIMRDVGDQPGALPLLQYALTELFEQREGRTLTKAAYHSIGGVLSALGHRAEEVFSQLDESGQSAARQLFLRLVTLGEGVEDTRRRVLRSEIESISNLQSLISKVIDAFGKSRLLTFDRDPLTRGPTVEVAHEALLREWKRLRGWLNESRADVRMQRQLATAATEWQSANRDASFLLRGARLAQFENWAANTGVALTRHEQDYLHTSLDLRAKEKVAEVEQQTREANLKQRVQRVLQVLVGVFLLAAIVNGGLAFWANRQREEALRQASIGLASQSILELDGASPERSVLLALEALDNYPYTWQAEQALANIVHEFRLRYIVTGHIDAVKDMAWSSDGRQFATTGKDGTLQIWEAQTRKELLNLPAHLVPITGSSPGASELAWSPDGNRIATAGLDKTAKVWDVATGKEITTFTGHTDEVWGVAWNPDGQWIASASKDGTAKVWDAQTGQEKYIFSKHTGGVQAVAWSPDGARIASAGTDGTVRIWQAENGAEQFVLAGHTNTVWSVAWSPDGMCLATAGDDSTVRIWDTKTGQQLSDLRLASPVWDAAWSPDGSQIATTSADGIAQVWDLASGKIAFALQGRTLEPFHIVWSPDGKWLGTTAGAGYSVRIWNATPSTLTLSGAQKVVFWVAWSPDGKRIATTYMDKTAVVWDSETGKALVTFRGHTDWVQDAFWSPDGSRIVTTDWDNIAKVWDANTGEELVTFTGHVGEPISRLQGTEGIVGGGWSPDGSRIMTQGGDGSVRIWDAQTGKDILVFQATKDLGANASWSPEGTRIASCAIPGVLQMWDALTGKPIYGGYVHNTANLPYGDPIDFCFNGGFSPDGKKFLTGSWNGNGATIWDTKTGEKILVFTGISDGGIGFSTWSPNGQRIASGNTNTGEVKIWDAETGAVLFSFKMPIGDYLFQLDWSPDGNRLIGDGMLDSVEIYRVWQTTEDLIAYAKECCVARELTSEERQQFGLP